MSPTARNSSRLCDSYTPYLVIPPLLQKTSIPPWMLGYFIDVMVAVISYTCFFFIYVYLLSCCYLSNWSPFNRTKQQAGGNYLHSATMIKKTPAFFILQVTNVHLPILIYPPWSSYPPPIHIVHPFHPPPPLIKKGGFTLWLVPASK